MNNITRNEAWISLLNYLVASHSSTHSLKSVPCACIFYAKPWKKQKLAETRQTTTQQLSNKVIYGLIKKCRVRVSFSMDADLKRGNMSLVRCDWQLLKEKISLPIPENFSSICILFNIIHWLPQVILVGPLIDDNNNM